MTAVTSGAEDNGGSAESASRTTPPEDVSPEAVDQPAEERDRPEPVSAPVSVVGAALPGPGGSVVVARVPAALAAVPQPAELAAVPQPAELAAVPQPAALVTGDAPAGDQPVPTVAPLTRAQLRAARQKDRRRWRFGRRQSERPGPAAAPSPSATAPDVAAAVSASQRRWRRVGWVALALVPVLVLSVLGLYRADGRPPVAAARFLLPASRLVPGGAAALPWPASGEAAMAIPALGVSAHSAVAEQPVPVASLTKMMTAYVVLQAHPLAPGENGPDITINAAEVADFQEDTVSDQANAQVTLGEVLTERQVLEGMLIHSANNFADTLAMWDAGSIAAFVAEMNADAQRLGMTATHFADPSGFDAQSMSTAADLLKVASADMALPTFAQIVDTPSVTLPVAGLLDSFTPLVGMVGVVGVKSGYTSQAGGCDVLALRPTLDGHHLLVLAAVTGQQTGDVLANAGLIALNIARHALAEIRQVRAVAAGQSVVELSTDGHGVPGVAVGPATVLAWPGQVVHQAFVLDDPPRAGDPAGTPAGTATFSVGHETVSVPVRTGGRLPDPSLLDRLF